MRLIERIGDALARLRSRRDERARFRMLDEARGALRLEESNGKAYITCNGIGVMSLAKSATMADALRMLDDMRNDAEEYASAMLDGQEEPLWAV